MTGWSDPGGCGLCGAKARWEKRDRGRLDVHVGHVLRRAGLLTVDERRQLLERLTSLGIDTAAQKGAASPAA